jgi:hypothetical protein
VKPSVLRLLTTVLLLVGSRTVGAQTITLSSGSAGTLVINAAIPGQDPTSASASITTYAVTTPAPQGTYRITASINQAMPAGTTLRLSMASPAGATSLGAVALTTTAQDVVINIPRKTNGTSLAITYTFDATPAAGVVPLTSRTITLAIGP